MEGEVKGSGRSWKGMTLSGLARTSVSTVRMSRQWSANAAATYRQ